MLHPLNPTHDLRLSGQVIYTGRSSMEVVVRIETMAKDTSEKDETILLGKWHAARFSYVVLKLSSMSIGRFSMVCRDAKTNQAYPVNPLIISTDEEKTLFSIGQGKRHSYLYPHFRMFTAFWNAELKLKRASLAQRSLSRVPPSSKEAAALHENYLKFGEVIDQPNHFGYHYGVWRQYILSFNHSLVLFLLQT